MACALIVLFLGCWLAGRSGVSGEGSYPKPSISVSPGGVIPVGGNVTIRCRHQRLGMRILFYKDGDGNLLNYTDPAGSEAEFPIPSARREHGGSYTCRYSNRTGPAAFSEPSDPVQIVVAEPSYPKPNISLHPSGGVAPGGYVTIRCECRCRGVTVFVYKAGHPAVWRAMDCAGDVVEFPISNVSQGDAGSYSCRYNITSDPPLCSEPSDPVELVVAEGTDPTRPGTTPTPTHPGSTGPSTGAPSTLHKTKPSYPKPNISLSPSGGVSLGGAVAIWCQGQHRGMRFVLDKEGRNVSHVDPVRSEAVFSISIVRWEHGGSYSCYYCNRSEPVAVSYPSDPVELVVRAPPDFTRANIAHLALGATVLLILGLILAEAYNSRPRGGTLGEVTPTSVPLSPPMSLDPTVQEKESPQGTSRVLLGS